MTREIRKRFEIRSLERLEIIGEAIFHHGKDFADATPVEEPKLLRYPHEGRFDMGKYIAEQMPERANAFTIRSERATLNDWDTIVHAIQYWHVKTEKVTEDLNLPNYIAVPMKGGK